MARRADILIIAAFHIFFADNCCKQTVHQLGAPALGEKARAYIRLFSGPRANHSDQGRGSGDVDAVTFPTAHNRTANGIQL